MSSGTVADPDLPVAPGDPLTPGIGATIARRVHGSGKGRRLHSVRVAGWSGVRVLTPVDIRHAQACSAMAINTIGRPMNVLMEKCSPPNHQPTKSATGGFAYA